jgi:predicted amidohydrolase
MDCVAGDVARNCEKIAAWVGRAKSAGCDAVVLPEMADTGYDMALVRDAASPWDMDDARTPLAIVAGAAREHGLYVVCGLSEAADGRIYNGCAVLDPRGTLVGRYRKSHLAAYPLLREDDYVHPGDALATARVGDLRWGLTICYDLRFPEVSRRHALDGCEVVNLCSAWPFPRGGHWRTLARARAIENQVYFIAANRTGTDGSVTFCGSSCIVDPYGVLVASAAEDREEMIVGEIRRETVAAVREYMPVLGQRREELY